MFLTVKEYEDLVMRERMSAYYRDKLDVLGDTQSDTTQKKKAQRDLLPDLYVNSDFFESIFWRAQYRVYPYRKRGCRFWLALYSQW